MVATLVWTVVQFMLPETLQGLLYALGAGVMMWYGWRHRKNLSRAVRLPVSLIIVSGTASLIGVVVRAVEGMSSESAFPFPSYADIFALFAYPFAAAAMIVIVIRRVRRISFDVALDAILTGLALSIVLWGLMILPFIQDDNFSSMGHITQIVYTLLSTALFMAAVMALVAGSRKSTANRMLAGALVITFFVDNYGTYLTATSQDEQLLLYLAPFIYVFGFNAFFHPSIDSLTDRPGPHEIVRAISNRRIGVMALALIAPPALVLYFTLTESFHQLLLPAVGSLALAPIIVIRLGRLVKERESQAALEASLRGVGERLVAAETHDDVLRIITVGMEELIGRNAVRSQVITFDQDRNFHSPSLDEYDDSEDVQAEILATVTSPQTADLIDLEPRIGNHAIAGLVIVNRDIVAALHIDLERPLREDKLNAIQSLCRETAIALRAVEQTERQVRERSEQRFAALIDNSSDIVAVLGRGMKLSYLSPVADRVLNSASSQPHELDVSSIVHPDDWDRAMQMVRNIRFGINDPCEIRIRREDGRYLWFEVVGTDLSSDPNINGLVLNLREITDRKIAEERLLHSEARFKSLVQHSTDLVIVIDEGGIIRYVSPSCESVLERTTDTVINAAARDIFTDSSIDLSTASFARLCDGSQAPALVEFGFHSGEDNWKILETSVSDLRDEPSVNGFVLNARDVTDRRSMEQRLRYQSTHDELTGLSNRTHLLESVTNMLERNSGSTSIAALQIDLDDFKDVNDSLGHEFGDVVLQMIADRIRNLLSFGDVAARIGGDEFAVVCERSHGEHQIMNLATEIIEAISEPLHVQGRDVSVSASAGVAFDHDRTQTGEVLLRNADTALFHAKKNGKRQATVFEHHMHVATFDRLELRGDLARAVAQEQFVNHYQPIVGLNNSEIIGFEALVRWQHPTRGLLGPGVFIPLAEETGLIDKIGEWVLEQAIKDLVKWRDVVGHNIEDIYVSVNLAVQQLRNPSLVQRVGQLLERYGLPARNLVLEVTESTLITEPDQVKSTMNQLRSLGARLAIDDFGTGYSSLGYIQDYTFEILKIDRSFVSRLSGSTNQQIVMAVIDMAQQLGVKTVAEGIEELEQAEILTDLGCDFGQGYLYSKPVSASEFLHLLRRGSLGTHAPQSGFSF